MPITHGTPTRNDICSSVAARVDGGGGPGKIKIRDASNVVLATIILAATSHNAPSGGVMTLAGLPKSDLDADAGGVAANFICTDAADVFCYAGSVTATGGGGDMTVGNTTFLIHQPISIATAAYTAPP